MRFLFVIQGEGNGHFSQSVSLSQLLAENNQNICGVAIGIPGKKIIPEYLLKNLQTNIYRYAAPGFYKTMNRKGINFFTSFLLNAVKYRKYIKSIRYIYSVISDVKPDIIVNFYEPLLGLTYKKYNINIPCYCISHHFLVNHPDFHLPRKMPISRFLLFRLNKITSYGACGILALSFRPMKDFPERKYYVSPPLIRKEILEIKNSDDNYILGYMLNEGHIKNVVKWHKKHPEQKAVFYINNSKKIYKKPSGPVFKNLNDREFIRDLSRCSGYITTAGFDSICEAMYFNKPVVFVPTPHHFEQLCNAYDAGKAGAGLISKIYDPQVLNDYIEKHNTLGYNYKEWVKNAKSFYIQQLLNI